MKLIHKVVVCATGATFVPIGTALPADAAPEHCPSTGYICAYDKPDYNVTGAICGWFNNDRDWSTCGEYSSGTSNMLNKASSVWNKSAGYGEPNNVNLYYNRPSENGGLSAWACIGQGDAWPWLGVRYFSWGPSGSGTGKNLATQDNITGHKWVNNCGDA
ncbi:peptidase inhibitor family I36 protein [Actinomadura sp. 7K534]|uniref:peptidase inhibitor family I36 protein n=1 Tax=Actinomadura sp. 7K534 TaxID=2530366 RepID=UPI0010514D94|nr:peptidase inhibitor family I36 protein [Actinomadura sp. 7K534]TDB85073.1 hypothetical protein E1266_36030 [Actinomadura sp. 7K534]